MLKELNRIVKEVSSVGNLSEALHILVSQLRSAIFAQAVSVYLLDDKNEEYVLVATDGLDESAEKKVRVPIDKGIIGLIGRREEPINVANAQEHVDFYIHPMLSEEGFNSFLGVPIIQHRKLYGVLVAQRHEGRYFEDAEEAFLITLAAQLGGIITHAESTGELTRLTRLHLAGKRDEDIHRVSLQGIGAVPGVGIGSAVCVYPKADIDNVGRRKTKDIEGEIDLFYKALQRAKEDMERLGRRIRGQVSESEHALFDVYIKLLEKENIGIEVETIIRQEKLTAQSALCVVVKKHANQLENMQDDYLSERAYDFKDLGRRILAELQYAEVIEIEYPKRTILVGEELTASSLAEVPEGYLAGIISLKGTSNSHVAILARGMGIPAVMGVKGLDLDKIFKRAVIVDGYYGQVYVSPSKKLVGQYKILAEEEKELNQNLVSLHDKPAETTDNYRISLQVNTGLAMDAGLSMSVGAEGVGLYRSEIPFLSRDRFPSEDEQYIIYKQILKAFAPRKVTMRTLDVGGDKKLPYFSVPEDNPYLGWRGIRVTLDHPDVFLLQLRAMMRANEGLNNLRIMLPMVTSLSELDEAIFLIDQAFMELLEEGSIIEKPEIGVMIEVPSAVFQAKEFARRVDFLSVGSNDLTQYLLAVDRNNARVGNLFNPLHPSMIRTLIKVVEGGHAAGVEVSICGEMASDPLAVILLLAMGFDMLSMSSFSLPRVKWVIRSFSMTSARKILSDVLEFEHAEEIKQYLLKSLETAGLGGLIRAGK